MLDLTVAIEDDDGAWFGDVILLFEIRCCIVVYLEDDNIARDTRGIGIDRLIESDSDGWWGTMIEHYDLFACTTSIVIGCVRVVSIASSLLVRGIIVCVFADEELFSTRSTAIGLSWCRLQHRLLLSDILLYLYEKLISLWLTTCEREWKSKKDREGRYFFDTTIHYFFKNKTKANARVFYKEMDRWMQWKKCFYWLCATDSGLFCSIKSLIFFTILL